MALVHLAEDGTHGGAVPTKPGEMSHLPCVLSQHTGMTPVYSHNPVCRPHRHNHLSVNPAVRTGYIIATRRWSKDREIFTFKILTHIQNEPLLPGVTPRKYNPSYHEGGRGPRRQAGWPERWLLNTPLEKRVRARGAVTTMCSWDTEWDNNSATSSCININQAGGVGESTALHMAVQTALEVPPPHQKVRVEGRDLMSAGVVFLLTCYNEETRWTWDSAGQGANVTPPHRAHQGARAPQA